MFRATTNLSVVTLIVFLWTQRISAVEQWTRVAQRVCYGYLDDQYGVFKLPQNVDAVQLRHVYGSLSCRKGYYNICPKSNWGNWNPNGNSNTPHRLNTWITETDRHKLVAPIQGDYKSVMTIMERSGSTYGYWYLNHAGSVPKDQTWNSNQLTFNQHFNAGTYHIWTGEDLDDSSGMRGGESDNEGTTCVDVYAKMTKSHTTAPPLPQCRMGDLLSLIKSKGTCAFALFGVGDPCDCLCAFPEKTIKRLPTCAIAGSMIRVSVLDKWLVCSSKLAGCGGVVVAHGRSLRRE